MLNTIQSLRINLDIDTTSIEDCAYIVYYVMACNNKGQMLMKLDKPLISNYLNYNSCLGDSNLLRINYCRAHNLPNLTRGSKSYFPLPYCCSV